MDGTILNKKYNLVERVKALEEGGSYVLPVASDEILGGVKVGDNLTIDENGVLSAEAGGGLHTYSTEEQEVGTWIDGKTLFERSYNIFSNGEAQYPVANSEYDIGLTGVDTAFIVNLYGERMGGSDEGFSDWCNTANELVMVLHKSIGKIYINPKSHIYKNFVVTIRYTKSAETRKRSKKEN